MTQIYPPVLDPKTLTRQVWDADTARRIPGMGRALDLISGLVAQMPLDVFAGITPLERPRFLDEPDLEYVLPTFLELHVVDYLLHGNAVHLVTARGADGWPAAVRWYPAQDWLAMFDPKSGRRRYWLRGREVSADDVVHVQNGADTMNTARGVGVVERYLRTLDKAGLQEERERTDLAGGYVPSVAVIAPDGGDETEDELDEAASSWEAKFSGPGRRAAMLPHGTSVVPLAWSPSDAQMVAARQLTLTDVGNIMNLDGYWLGAPASSHTYRTPGAMFLVLLRTTVNRILAPFEAKWSQRWVVRGKRVSFARDVVLGDDLKTTIDTLVKATGGAVMTRNEGRARLALPGVDGGDEFGAAPVAEPDPAPAPDDDPMGPPPPDNPDDPTTEETP